MRRAIVLVVFAIGLPHAGVAGDAAVAMRPPETLQTMWNERMLEGRAIDFYDGREQRSESTPCLQPSGWMWLHEVATSTCGLRVVDLRERRWLKSRGGWVLNGGPLGALEVGGQRIELYGKSVVRHEPHLQPWPHVWIGEKVWNAFHEFVLLSRNRHAERATVLRSWTVPDPEASGGRALTPRGRLECQEPCGTIRVHVMDGHDRDVLSELVPVSKRGGP